MKVIITAEVEEDFSPDETAMIFDILEEFGCNEINLEVKE